MSAPEFDAQTLPWTDRADFPAVLATRAESGAVSEPDADRLRGWRNDGYMALPGLVEPTSIDRLLADVERGWSRRPRVKLLVEGRGETWWKDAGSRADVNRHHRIMDFQDTSRAAQDLLLHESIVRVLRLILDAPPVAMQSLYFEFGSEQRLHQDYPYVSAQILSHLVGCWIACEDVTSDNGPLFYYRGSHRLPKFDWGNGSLRFTGDDETRVERFESHLADTAAAAGLERVTLHAKKGDVFLWHVALIHGGSPADHPERTRKSLVVHYSSPQGYPRDRRYPDLEPRRLRRGDGVLYLPPRFKGLRRRLGFG